MTVQAARSCLLFHFGKRIAGKSATWLENAAAKRDHAARTCKFKTIRRSFHNQPSSIVASRLFAFRAFSIMPRNPSDRLEVSRVKFRNIAVGTGPLETSNFSTQFSNSFFDGFVISTKYSDTLLFQFVDVFSVYGVTFPYLTVIFATIVSSATTNEIPHVDRIIFRAR